MPLRRDKKRSVMQAAAAPIWQVTEGQHNGRPMATRFNAAFRQVTGRDSYSVEIGVVVTLNQPDHRGLPLPPEVAQLDAIEDRLVSGAAGRAVLAAVISGSGVREYVMYSRYRDWIDEFEQSVRAEVFDHDIQVLVHPDPDWGIYRRLLG